MSSERSLPVPFCFTKRCKRERAIARAILFATGECNVSPSRCALSCDRHISLRVRLFAPNWPTLPQIRFIHPLPHLSRTRSLCQESTQCDCPQQQRNALVCRIHWSHHPWTTLLAQLSLRLSLAERWSRSEWNAPGPAVDRRKSGLLFCHCDTGNEARG